MLKQMKMKEGKREEEEGGGGREKRGRAERPPGISKTLLQSMGLGVQQRRFKFSPVTY